MALTGIEIYKLLPKTNCKKCKFPTCLAFAMKVAQKSVEITLCPDLSAVAKAALESAARPPIRLVTFSAGDRKIEIGNEVVMFRHEKTFYHPPALMLHIKDSDPTDETAKLVAEAANFIVERVGIKLQLDGFAIENISKNPATFAQCVATVKAKATLPLVLMSTDPKAIASALDKVADDKPLIYAANKENWEHMAELALGHKCPLAVAVGSDLNQLAELTEKIVEKGVEDIVIDPVAGDFCNSIIVLTQLRRLALKKNLRSLGYPVITFPGQATESMEEEAALAGQQIAKYAGIIVLNHFNPAVVYPLLTLRMNIYTDPQKPIQIKPDVYPIGTPRDDSPLCVTTNFALTYFSIAGELEASGWDSWLLVCDTEGLSVLTSWAAGKFDAEKIAKSVKGSKIADKIKHRNIIIPGKVAVLRGELEEELPEWKIMVGPPEAMDIGPYLKQMWKV